MFNKLKSTNIYLTTGILLTSILILISIFGDFLVPYDANSATTTITDPITKEITAAPFPPSMQHWLGTDELGVDLITKLLMGAKYTISVVFIIGISRIIIALPLGLIAGMYPKYFKKIMSYINKTWSSVPTFLLVYILISPVVLSPIGIYSQILLMWIILTFVGLPSLTESIRGHVERIKEFEFMEGVKILGGSYFYIMRKHIFPHLKPNLVILLSMEMVQILWLLGQLGIFHIFIGGTIASYDFETGSMLYYSKTNEWAGLLGTGRKYFLSAPWISFAPALAFAYGILSLTLLSEGLKRKIDKNTIKYDF